jgi:hypothetical protein
VTDYYHQPINVPNAGAQAFLMHYTSGERAITHHAGPLRVGMYVLQSKFIAGQNHFDCKNQSIMILPDVDGQNDF